MLCPGRACAWYNDNNRIVFTNVFICYGAYLSNSPNNGTHPQQNPIHFWTWSSFQLPYPIPILRYLWPEWIGSFWVHHTFCASLLWVRFWVSLWPRQFGPTRTMGLAWLCWMVLGRETVFHEVLSEISWDALELTWNNVIGLLLGLYPRLGPLGSATTKSSHEWPLCAVNGT